MHKNTKLGWIGLGVMGEPMCQHLMNAGYSLSVTTRSKEQANAILPNGAQWCDSAMEVCQQSDVVFTMVGIGQEVADVYFSSRGLFTTDIQDKVFIDMGTTAPALTLKIAQYAKKEGATSIDAPVSGGDIGAKNATLSIMAGGDAETLERVSGLFDCLGKVTLMGKSGSGQHTKMCNQITVAGTMIGVCEALVYAKKSGLDCEVLIAAISRGAAGCWSLDNLAPRAIKQDFSPGFMVDHFIKDLAIALSEVEAMQLELPGLALAKSLYDKVSEIGHGKSGTQALLLVLEKD